MGGARKWGKETVDKYKNMIHPILLLTNMYVYKQFNSYFCHIYNEYYILHEKMIFNLLCHKICLPETVIFELSGFAAVLRFMFF